MYDIIAQLFFVKTNKNRVIHTKAVEKLLKKCII